MRGRSLLLALTVAAGAIAGLIYSALRAPLYQAEAVLAIGIDYGRTVPLELMVEDRALDRVYQLLVSDAVLEAARAEVQREMGNGEGWSDLAAFREHIVLEQRLSDWHLIARDRDPYIAAAIAEAWSREGLRALQQAWGHAWRAAELQGGPFNVVWLSPRPPELDVSIFECLAHGPDLDPEERSELLQEIAAMLLGFLLAPIGVAYLPRDFAQAASWYVPILVLGVPLFVMGLVVFSRLRRRRRVDQPGSDHTYHRLAGLGEAPTRAVFSMQAAGIVLGLLAFIRLSAGP